MDLTRKWMSRARIQMKLSRTKGASVQLGRYNHGAARPALRNHEHRGAMEICFLVKGLQTYQVDSRRYRLRGGDVFVTFPDERHSTGGRPEEKGVLYWMILEIPEEGEGLLGISVRESRILFNALLAIPQRHFRGSWKMKDHLDAITALHQKPRSALNTLAIKNHAGAFLLEVVACARATEDRGTDQRLQSLLRYIADHVGEPMSIPSLAAKTGLSVPRFQARFKQEIGMPPGEYILRARVEEGQKRLENGTGSITEIAHELGFSSSQYFATVFKRFRGYPPSGARGHKKP